MAFVAPPIWHAAPPEVHSTLLNIGGTAAGITVAGASWTQLSAQYLSAIAELEGILMTVQATYQGPSAEKFVQAHLPMMMWMADVAAKSGLAAAAHAEVAAGYETAVATMPTMPELLNNHVVNGILVGTNFFGCNTVPIGMNEADYVRMWNQAADVMGAWDVGSTAAADSVPVTPPSPITLIPGVGESGSVAATAAGFSTTIEAQAGGASITAADLMGSKLVAGKAVTSPASYGNKIPNPTAGTDPAAAADEGDELAQGLDSDTMAGSSFLQQASSMASPAASALQAPAQLLTQAPQALASAPQQLGSMLSQFAGGTGGSGLGQAGGMPLGFAGTGALKGFSPGGLTSLAGGAFGTGPSRPLMPSTWGASPTSAAESLPNSARGLSPLASGIPGSGASGSGAGGGGMMGAGAQNKRRRSQQVNTYSDDAVDDEDADADSDGGVFAMTR